MYVLKNTRFLWRRANLGTHMAQTFTASCSFWLVLCPECLCGWGPMQSLPFLLLFCPVRTQGPSMGNQPSPSPESTHACLGLPCLQNQWDIPTKFVIQSMVFLLQQPDGSRQLDSQGCSEALWILHRVLQHLTESLTPSLSDLAEQYRNQIKRG